MNWRNLLSPRKVALALQIEARTLATLAANGRPDALLQFLGGLGDELLLTCVAHEIRRREPRARVWQVSPIASLLRGNADYHRVFDDRHWWLRHSNLLASRRRRLRYTGMIVPGEREHPPHEHVLAALCRAAGLRGRVELRPWLHLWPEELARGRVAARQIALQSVGAESHANAQRNKIWGDVPFRELARLLRDRHPGVVLVQLGVAGDPTIDGAVDLRGRATFRESAAVLANSLCFVGTAGFLSHVARAVECRSVIVYGGREHAWQTGYPCNENLESHLPCAPCWRWNTCERERECLRAISPEDVLEAVTRTVERREAALETQTADLGEGT